jgi:hypothetical protein
MLSTYLRKMPGCSIERIPQQPLGISSLETFKNLSPKIFPFFGQEISFLANQKFYQKKKYFCAFCNLK